MDRATLASKTDGNIQKAVDYLDGALRKLRQGTEKKEILDDLWLSYAKAELALFIFTVGSEDRSWASKEKLDDATSPERILTEARALLKDAVNEKKEHQKSNQIWRAQNRILRAKKILES